MIHKLKQELFNPGILSLFFNPVFFIRRRLHSQIKSEVSDIKGIVMDFGCGSKPYRSLFIECKEYIGVDFEPIEASKDPQVDVYYNGKEIPFEDKKFDAIFCTEVVEHLFNLDEILEEFHRVLKDDGKIIFTYPFAWPEHAQPYDFARYTSFATRHLMEKHNYSIIKYEKTGNFIEVIAQLIAFYFNTIMPGSTVMKFILSAPFVFLANLFGVIFSFILPKNKDLYFNNFVVVKKAIQ
jgi:SAM-dependent methyltransferase